MPDRERHTRRFHRSVALAGLAAIHCACGSVGAPRPPLVNLPSPVRDLAARQVGDGIDLTWTRPVRTTEGEIARDIGGFTLWAVDVPSLPAELAVDTIDDHRRQVATLEAPDLANAEPGGRLELRSPLSAWQLGQTAILVVTAWNAAGRDGGYSNQVAIQPLQPPGAPGLREPAVTAQGVALTWLPADLADEYAIERSDSEGGAFATLGRLATESFLDRAVAWGRSHRYRLRPYRMSDAEWIEGPLSETLAVTPIDTFPPAPPQGLRAVRTPTSVELSWLPAGEEDVAGYRVLRGGAALGPLVTGTSYSDGTATAGTPYEYEVTAVDADGNESSAGEGVAVPPHRP